MSRALNCMGIQSFHRPGLRRRRVNKLLHLSNAAECFNRISIRLRSSWLKYANGHVLLAKGFNSG